MTIHSKGTDMLVRLMSAATTRRDVLANNIASQNLPGYRRQDVQFEKLLFEEMQRGGTAKELEQITPEIVTDWETPGRADGNNVSAEQEASLMTENRIRYELYATILRSQQSLVGAEKLNIKISEQNLEITDGNIDGVLNLKYENN